MLRFLCCAIAALFMSAAYAARAAERPTAYDLIIARHAKANGVPEAFVHRIVMRESRYKPGVVRNRCYGLMQIKHATARSMGYSGEPRGLLDPEVNLTYAVPYLANAYRLAEGNEDRATALFSRGYYDLAKRKKMLGELRTATTAAVGQQTGPQPPVPPRSPIASLFSFLAGPPGAAAAKSPPQPEE
ncbi:MAG: lytic transglycosylase domain-containing protein [Beijerinckiaceae bacterium]|nr:lytic transglycosylase domain-containing protein [Beijerinckiaceae bacterium]